MGWEDEGEMIQEEASKGVLEEKTLVWLSGLFVDAQQECEQEGEPQGNWWKYLPSLFKAPQLVCGERTVLRVEQIFKIVDKHVDLWR